MAYNYTRNALQKKIRPNRLPTLRIAAKRSQLNLKKETLPTSSSRPSLDPLIQANQLINDLLLTIKIQEATIEEMSTLNHELLHRNRHLINVITK